MKTMNATAGRWYPVLLLRNALGRFMALRVTLPSKPLRRQPRRPIIVDVQLALF